jgi:hypothetical protein
MTAGNRGRENSVPDIKVRSPQDDGPIKLRYRKAGQDQADYKSEC